MRRVAAAAMLVAFASTPVAALELDAAGLETEAACVKVGLGVPQCACIAADDMERNDPPLRELVLMSLEDIVGFGIRVRSGEFPPTAVAELGDYQQFVQLKCSVAQ